MRALLLVATMMAALIASDADLRDELRTVYREAAAERDLWTMLQIEAWCDANDIRKRDRVFGKATIFGNPLLAVPDGIAYHHDRGHVILVIGSRRLYQWAPDGRPLRPSMPIPNGCNMRAASNDGRYVYIGDYDRDTDEQTYQLRGSLVDAHRRRILYQHEIVLKGDHGHDYDAGIADDGSAVLVGFRAQTDDKVSRDGCYLVLDGKREPRFIPNLVHPRVVGPKGRWFVAEDPGPDGGWLLVVGEDRIRLRHFIDGPDDRLAFIDQDAKAVQVIDGKARIQQLQTPFPISGHSDILAAGPWLAVDGRGEARTRESIDIFGKTIHEKLGAEHAFYAWADLDTPQQAEPRHRGTGTLAPDNHQPAAVLTWQGGTVRRLSVDPAAEGGLRDEVLTDLGQVDIGWISCGAWHYQGSISSGEEWQTVIFDLAGREGWRGPRRRHYSLGVDRCLALENWDQPDSFRLLSLAGEAAQRRETALAMEAGSKHQRFDVYGQRAYLYRGSLWYEIDLHSGALQGYDRERQLGFRPDFLMPWGSQGSHRHLQAGARLFPTSLSFDTDWGERLDLQQFADALQVPGGIVAAGRSGHLLAIDQRNGGATVLGRLSQSDLRLHQSKNLDLAVIDPQRERLVAIVANGGRKLQTLPGEGAQVADRPGTEGSWKVDGQAFDMGRYGKGEWPHDAPFRPHRLRSHSGAADLLIVTRSCVIAIGARDMARLLSRFED